MTPARRCPTCDKPVGPLHPWAVAAQHAIMFALSAGIVALAVVGLVRVVRGVVS